MTGIERLRTLAGAWDEWGLGGALTEIADEIERERAEDCYRMGFDCGTVWRVVADMERHCLGHEGMEDSPVARWARELREALGGNGRDHAADVSVSAYDLLPQEDREAIVSEMAADGYDEIADAVASKLTRSQKFREKVAAALSERGE